MRKKLLLLDLALIALIALAGMRVRQAWLEARKREAVVLGKPVRPLPPPPYQPIQPPPAVSGADYNDVAQLVLFNPERNPTVVIEVAPPKPMPALPVVYGVFDLGMGPSAIMSAKSGGPQQEYRAGQSIGEFKVIALSAREIVFEWDGKKVPKKIEELIDRSVPAAPSAPLPQRSSAPPPDTTSTTTVAPGSPFGNEMGGGIRACLANDNSPAGTVMNGYTKVISRSPFGRICRWEPVK